MALSSQLQEAAFENPFRAGLQTEQRSGPFTMVIMGAHGDLAKRKLLPALYALFEQGLLSQGFCLVGLSRTQMSNEQFRGMMRESVEKFGDTGAVQDASWEHFASALYYLPTDFSDAQAFSRLAATLAEVGERHGCRDRNIHYLSTPPSLYDPIIKHLAEAGLADRQKSGASWPRIVVEKPFGRDLNTARELNMRLHEVFDESQIYRIDHYLGKETVQNIMVLRFANGMFEPLWNRKHIDHIQITNAETLGVENRAAYYEEAGALRDMIQNHMLQLVSLVAMEPPISTEPDAIRDERAKVLKAIRPIDCGKLNEFAVRGQYGSGYVLGQNVPAYRSESRVDASSNTETFAALKLFIDNWRWAGVPFFVRSGKRLAKRTTEIAVHFRPAPLKLFGQDDFPGSGNVLVMQIQPNEGISLKFATKLPGTSTELRWLNMDFRYGTAFGGRTPDAYERLIYDCIIGDPSLFARTDQVETAWRLITPVLECWAKIPGEFPNYASGSWGPACSDALIEEEGYAWRRL